MVLCPTRELAVGPSQIAIESRLRWISRFRSSLRPSSSINSWVEHLDSRGTVFGGMRSITLAGGLSKLEQFKEVKREPLSSLSKRFRR